MPSPQPGTAGGYVNGVFGTDSVGSPRRYGRIFIGPAAHGRPIADNYRTEPAHVFDIFAFRPFRNAVIGAKEAR